MKASPKEIRRQPIQNATQSAQSIDTLASLRKILPERERKGKHTFVDILTLGG
jgi:hypothetical protein